MLKHINVVDWIKGEVIEHVPRINIQRSNNKFYKSSIKWNSGIEESKNMSGNNNLSCVQKCQVQTSNETAKPSIKNSNIQNMTENSYKNKYVKKHKSPDIYVHYQISSTHYPTPMSRSQGQNVGTIERLCH